MMRLPLIISALLAGPVAAELPVTDLPNYDKFAILAYGFGPQYLGADETTSLPVPAGRLNFGEYQSVTLMGNYLTTNLLDHPNWRLGPAGILRFGRGDVDNDAVAALPDIDPSLDLGLNVAYVVKGDDIRERWVSGVTVMQDVTGAHGGLVASASSHVWMPVGKYGAFAIGGAVSWGSGDYMDTYFSVSEGSTAASGLPRYTAGSGTRDARVMAIFIHPLNERWAVGAGVLYSRLLGDAGDSPVVGNRNQLIGGIGVLRAW